MFTWFLVSTLMVARLAPDTMFTMLISTEASLAGGTRVVFTMICCEDERRR